MLIQDIIEELKHIDQYKKVNTISALRDQLKSVAKELQKLADSLII